MYVNYTKNSTKNLPYDSRQFWTSAPEMHDSLYLAIAYRKFCMLCIWFLTKLLRIRLKSPFSYIFRTISYLHAIYHRQNLNFSKMSRLEDEKKLVSSWQTVLRGSNTTRNVSVLPVFFQFSCSKKCRQSPFCFPI